MKRGAPLRKFIGAFTFAAIVAIGWWAPAAGDMDSGSFHEVAQAQAPGDSAWG